MEGHWSEERWKLVYSDISLPKQNEANKKRDGFWMTILRHSGSNEFGVTQNHQSFCSNLVEENLHLKTLICTYFTIFKIKSNDIKILKLIKAILGALDPEK